MSKSRSIVLLGSLGIGLLLIAAWFLLLSPRLATASDLNTQREALEQENTRTQARIDELEEKKANIAAAKADADELTKKFPPTAAESDLFRLVRAAAKHAGIPEKNVSDLTAGVPVLGAGDGSVTLPNAQPPAADPNAATDPNAAPAAGSDAAAAATPAPAPSGTRLGTMTLDVTVTGSQAQIIRFLHALENMDRAYLVHSITTGKGEGRNGSTATISGEMYLLPELLDPTAPAKDASAPATPTGSETPAATETPAAQ